ncbi:MAG: GDSL-type esterase/lipase family protein [Lachnospiraceae bacterium]|nr:GDSL-type esterase/lipase family protein [Lachnospiraceae bacterium]
MQNIRIRNLIILIAVIVAAILVAVRVKYITQVPLKSEAAETRLVLDALADQDISAIQDEIDLKRDVSDDENDVITVYSDEGNLNVTTEDLLPLAELQEMNFTEIFSNCVIMGDSIAHQLLEYEVLNSAEVIAQDGMQVHKTEEQISTAVDLAPKVVFLTYGLNDIDDWKSDFESFRENYDDFLTRVQSALPNAQIYVTLILPVNNYALEEHEAYRYIDEYNQVIVECCEAHGIPYMDLEFTLPDEYYDDDGIHPLLNFYYGWLYCMAKGAGLI